MKGKLDKFESDLDERLQDSSFKIDYDFVGNINIIDNKDKGTLDEPQDDLVYQQHFPNLIDRDQCVTIDEKEDYTEDSLDNLIGVNLNVPSGEGVSRATVKKRIKDHEENPIG